MSLASDSTARYVSWLLVLVGLWILVSPWVYADDIGGAALNNSVGSGVVVIALAGYLAYALHGEARPE